MPGRRQALPLSALLPSLIVFVVLVAGSASLLVGLFRKITALVVSPEEPVVHGIGAPGAKRPPVVCAAGRGAFRVGRRPEVGFGDEIGLWIRFVTVGVCHMPPLHLHANPANLRSFPHHPKKSGQHPARAMDAMDPPRWSTRCWMGWRAP